ncbi:MAG TPA: methylenetetrahydrofolate reductase C-terminal domain-containing protein [Gaiellaceae bacterium]|nr:methylenetetrahydrofolate reductase C-terminal domain-containing protein [Gaiellaceae bacterium]
MGALAAVERAVKGPLFGCQMCGQCVLHDTGLTCPMTCPKRLRNGPCGGVREDGSCEVVPAMRCVWVQAERRARTLPLLPPAWREHFHELRPPVDHRLFGQSAWLNALTGRDRVRPAGWSLAAGESGGERGRPA